MIGLEITAHFATVKVTGKITKIDKDGNIWLNGNKCYGIIHIEFKSLLGYRIANHKLYEVKVLSYTLVDKFYTIENIGGEITLVGRIILNKDEAIIMYRMYLNKLIDHCKAEIETPTITRG